MRWEINTEKETGEVHMVTILDGKLVLVTEGNFIMLNVPVILTNGSIITTEGLMKMPDGRSRMLQEGEYV